MENISEIKTTGPFLEVLPIPTVSAAGDSSTVWTGASHWAETHPLVLGGQAPIAGISAKRYQTERQKNGTATASGTDWWRILANAASTQD